MASAVGVGEPDGEQPEPAEPAERPDLSEPAELGELRERLHRALADADNARKWAARQIAEQRRAERQAVATAWLPVLDHLDAALQHAHADPQSIIEGVNQVRREAQQVLTRLGYTPIDTTGEPFSPHRHQAAEVDHHTETPPGTITRILRPGYGTDDNLLRPAIVAVSDGGPDAG